MRIFGYLGIGFLIVWLLAPAPMAITVADTAPVQAVAPEATQSPSEPTRGLMLQRQNQTDRLERLQDLAEDAEDILNILD
jgi:hypothetical protein